MKYFLRILLAAVLGMVASVASAEDFAVDGIYYEITSSTTPYTVAVTYRGTYITSYSNEYTGSVTIPESVTYSGKTYRVTSIGNSAFRDCTGLTSVTIPESVTEIGGCAFWECSGLTSVTIPESVTEIDVCAFSGCTSLTSVTIPESVTSIGMSAFYKCTGLTSIEIPNSVTSIGSRAFDGTAWYDNQSDGVVYAGKVAYTYKGTMPDNTEIVLEEGTLGIGGSAFRGCTGLTSVTIPQSVTQIWDGAFFGCTGLTSVTIPNSVTSIDDSAFEGCSGLTSVTIGNSVTSIGYEAFRGCPLTSIHCYAEYPPTCSKLAFSIEKPNCKLYVRPGSVDMYSVHQDWYEFNILSLDDEALGIEDVNVNSNETDSETLRCEKGIYDLSGRKVNDDETLRYDNYPSKLKKGIYIVNGRKTVVR